MERAPVSRACFVFALVILCASCTPREGRPAADIARARDTDCGRFGLVGNVAQWTRKSFRYMDASEKQKKILLQKEHYTFNEYCMIIVAEECNEHDVVVSRTVYAYSPAGAITGEEHFDGNYTLLINVQYTYDAGGKKATEIRDDRSAGVTYVSRWDHDAHGNPVRFTRALRDQARETLITEETTRYHANGAVAETRKTEYRYDGSIQFRRIITHRTDGKPERLEEYNGKNERVQNETFEYDGRGNLTSHTEEFINPETKTLTKNTTVSRYDDADRLIETHGPDGSRTVRYDEKGKKTEEINDSGDGHPRILYRFSYDGHGNHTRTECYRLEKGEARVLAMSYEYDIVYGD